MHAESTLDAICEYYLIMSSNNLFIIGDGSTRVYSCYIDPMTAGHSSSTYTVTQFKYAQ